MKTMRDTVTYNPSNISLPMHDWCIPQFLKPLTLRKMFKINTIASFVIGHLFLKARSFSQAMLLENSVLLRTDNVCGQIYPSIFLHQMEADNIY